MDGTAEPSRDDARRLSWHEAPEAILALARDASSTTDRILIGVTGPVGSGKSTLARRLGGVTLRTDDYLPDYEGLPEHERDLPERADLARLAENLDALRQGRAATAPVWCFHEHRRTGERTIEPAELVVCEGIHALHATVVERFDVRVFVEAPAEVRWERWKAIELDAERGWGVEQAKSFFDQVAEPTFHDRAPAYRRAAHVIVINDQRAPAPEDRA